MTAIINIPIIKTWEDVLLVAGIFTMFIPCLAFCFWAVDMEKEETIRVTPRIGYIIMAVLSLTYTAFSITLIIVSTLLCVILYFTFTRAIKKYPGFLTFIGLVFLTGIGLTSYVMIVQSICK